MEEHRHTINGIKTRYNLAHAQLRAGTYSSGLEEVERDVKARYLPEYIARCLISRGLYLEEDLTLVETGIQQLKENELFFECSEVTAEIAAYYKERGDVQTASHYMELSHLMRHHHVTSGVDQS
ncbi:hypothetical protein [Bacillus sp. JCM 19041]|uniref:hypothetical protein n=1 Tax=Bacillus sp. JCM 19041 TaxID=1460637 RepID=UPI0006D25EB8